MATKVMTGAYPGFKEGGAKCTGAKRPGKILGCYAHFWSRERACGRGQTQTRDRSRSSARTIIIDGHLRLETKGPALQC